jgi:hypothetical protein
MSFITLTPRHVRAHSHSFPRPSPLRALQYAKMAMDHGKNVLVEKPLASSVAEMEELKQHADKCGVVCMPVHNCGHTLPPFSVGLLVIATLACKFSFLKWHRLGLTADHLYPVVGIASCSPALLHTPIVPPLCTSARRHLRASLVEDAIHD